MSLKKYEEALEDLKQAEKLAESLICQGIAYARLGDYENAAKRLESYIQKRAEDKRGPWLKELIQRLSVKRSKKFALLIGIGNFQMPGIPSLSGPRNDIAKMRRLLLEQLYFPPQNVKDLIDSEATHKGIFEELATLKNKVNPNDSVFIYYNGHSFGGDSPLFLVPFDTDPASSFKNAISAEELHEALNLIPAKNKILVLDSQSNKKFVEIASKQTSYTTFLGGTDYEQLFGEVIGGVFTRAFIQQLECSSLEETDESLMGAMIERAKSIEPKADPILLGARYQPIFSDLVDLVGLNLNYFDFSQRENFEAFSPDEIHRVYKELSKNLSSTFPQLYSSLGCALLEKGYYQEALQALQFSVQQSGDGNPKTKLALGISQLRTLRYSDARDSFISYCRNAPDHEWMKEPLEMLDTLSREHAIGIKHALLVDIDNYDSEEMKKVLMEKCGFTDVNLITNIDATYETVIESFRNLVKKASEEIALFYFAGAGSVEERAPGLLCGAGKDRKTIKLIDLAEIARKEPNNLVTILDAHFDKEPQRKNIWLGSED